MSGVFSDLESLRQNTDGWLTTREIETEALKRRRSGYVRGPFTFSDFCAAARLPGKALAVWCLLQHRMRLTRQAEVTLPNSLLESAGIDRNAKARALRDLEAAGLVQVSRLPGQSPRVALPQPPEPASVS